MRDGAALAALNKRITATIAAAQSRPDLEGFAMQLTETLATVGKTTKTLLRCATTGDLDTYLANSHDYMQMFGHTVIAWIWLKQALVAVDALGAGVNLSDTDRAFYLGKLHTTRYFFNHELIKVEPLAKLCMSLDDTNPTMQPKWFF